MFLLSPSKSENNPRSCVVCIENLRKTECVSLGVRCVLTGRVGRCINTPSVDDASRLFSHEYAIEGDGET